MKNINQRRIGSRLKRCLSSLAVIFSLFLASIQTLQAQDRDFSGQALDQNGEPLSGVTVAIVGSSKGTVTDANGHYTLKVPPQAILKFSYLGYKPQVVNVNEKKSILNVTMEEDAVLLSETVVVAMDMRRDEKSLATAIQKVDIESMTESRDGSFVNMLAGKVANLQVISNGAGGSTRVILRGNNSLTGNNQALFVIDGVAIVNDMGMTDGEDLDYGNPANGINPDDIESVTVLKGANAAALYGSDAANGVIVITTKKATKKNGLGISFSSNLQFNKLMQYPIYQNIYGAGTNNTLHAGYNYLTGRFK
jgi:TonB-dependent SusC/RagA subfamily outer membrane receptor